MIWVVIAFIGFIGSIFHLVGTTKKGDKAIYRVGSLVSFIAALVLFIHFGTEVIK